MSPSPSVRSSFRTLVLVFALGSLAAACSSDGQAPAASGVTTTTAEQVTTSEATPSTVDQTTTSEATTTTADPDSDMGEGLLPADLGLPVIGTITELQVGDISCYATVFDALGNETSVGATFEMCERGDDVLDVDARLLYSVASVADCESSEPCGRSRDEFLISDVLTLGAQWLVQSNADWIVTVGNLDTWAGVDNTGALTYYGCEANPGPLVPGLNDPQAGCLALEGGTVDCSGGTCTMAWRNGDFSYLLVGPIAEFGDPGPTTLQVLESDTVILESPGLEIVGSSDGVVLPRPIEIDAGEFETMVAGAVIRGDRDEYSIDVAAGQTMVLSITSVEDNAVFDLYAPTGGVLVAESIAFEVSTTDSGVYRLVVGGTRGNTTYEVAVAVR